MPLEGALGGFEIARAKRQPASLPVGVSATLALGESFCHFAEEAAGGALVILQQIHVGRRQQRLFKPRAFGRGGAQLGDVIGDQFDVRTGKLDQVIKPLRSQFAARIGHPPQQVERFARAAASPKRVGQGQGHLRTIGLAGLLEQRTIFGGGVAGMSSFHQQRCSLFAHFNARRSDRLCARQGLQFLLRGRGLWRQRHGVENLLKDLGRLSEIRQLFLGAPQG